MFLDCQGRIRMFIIIIEEMFTYDVQFWKIPEKQTKNKQKILTFFNQKKEKNPNFIISHIN